VDSFDEVGVGVGRCDVVDVVRLREAAPDRPEPVGTLRMAWAGVVVQADLAVAEVHHQ